MVRDAEKYRAEDLAYASKIKAKNALETATYNMKNSLAEEKIRSKLGAEDVATLQRVVADAQRWIDEHMRDESTTREQFEERLKEMEKVCGPVWQRYIKAEKEHRGAGEEDD